MRKHNTNRMIGYRDQPYGYRNHAGNCENFPANTDPVFKGLQPLSHKNDSEGDWHDQTYQNDQNKIAWHNNKNRSARNAKGRPGDIDERVYFILPKGSERSDHLVFVT